ncbi:MAG: DUF5110 domain-containing protein [Acidimicrobiales bacterium]|nr:DUF5110 domain-containing protein [Acidimicrobiales bacterium]
MSQSFEPTASEPTASPDQVVAAGRVRVTVLTDRLLRIEYAEDGTFEDRPTLAVVNRRFPAPRFRSKVVGDALTVDTGAVSLHCSDVTRPFTGRRLQATLSGSGVPTGKGAGRATSTGVTSTWKFGQVDRGNLGGTVRTLDTWMGNKTARAVGFDPETGFIREWDEQQLEPGLLSRSGWTVVDDTSTVVLDAVDGPGARARRWPVPRPPGERTDLYLFAYGTDHRAALRDAARLLGPQPLPPRFAFGYWYSRYYPYTDHELLDLAAQFDHLDIPADVLVIDMDWHRLGWTGYSWDHDLFPNPTDTLDQIHQRGLRIAMNLHPADGVGSHEDAFEAVCEAMAVDPETTDRIPFDVTDPRFIDAYFRLLHHPEEDRGVDFWWMDWQQGTESLIPGLDPLAWLNQLHWDDLARRRPNRRPLAFSRWGGLGAGRYPVGFSGDTVAVWESLAYQPEFTATAANALYGYWSHDIGGHYGDVPDPELYARWIQFGVHSPVLRTHGSLGPEQERKVWEFPNPYRTVMIDAIRRRYELVPYVYGECRKGVETGLSLVRPMYHEHPETEAAYGAAGQYQFGDQMVVAPVVSPLDDDAMAAVRVWLPEGDWFDVAHGRRLTAGGSSGGGGEGAGGQWFERRYLLSETPVFVRAGTVVPGQRDVRRLDQASYPNLVITAYPGSRGGYELYEDDGTSTGYLKGRSVTVPLAHRTTARIRSIQVGPAEGSYRGWERRRPVEARFVGEVPPKTVRVDDVEVPWVANAPAEVGAGRTCWWYDAAEATVVVSLPRVDLRSGVVVSLDRATAAVRRSTEPLLDGYPGLARRVALADRWTRTLLQEDNRRLVGLSRTTDRMDRASSDPATVTSELSRLRSALPDVDPMLEKYVERWKETESLNPLDPPINSRTIEAARRLLATTTAQFLG